MINADNVKEGLSNGKDIALLVEMKFHNTVEQMVTYCTNGEYNDMVDDITSRGDKIVECKRLNTKMIQEMEQRASERTGRLGLIADMQNHLKELGL